MSPSSYQRNNYCANWIKQLIKQKLKYEIQILFSSPTDIGLQNAEKFWIYELQCRGFQLTNLTPGGDGWAIGMKHTAETKAKISAAHRGRKHSSEHCINQGLAKRGCDTSKATEAARQVNTGRKMKPFSNKHRAQISAARKAQIGLQKRTSEQKIHMSQAQIKRPIERIDLITGEVQEFESISSARRLGFSPKFSKTPRRYQWNYI